MDSLPACGRWVALLAVLGGCAGAPALNDGGHVQSEPAREAAGALWGEVRHGLQVGLEPVRSTVTRGSVVPMVLHIRNAQRKPVTLSGLARPGNWSAYLGTGGRRDYVLESAIGPRPAAEGVVTLAKGETRRIPMEFGPLARRELGPNHPFSSDLSRLDAPGPGRYHLHVAYSLRWRDARTGATHAAGVSSGSSEIRIAGVDEEGVLQFGPSQVGFYRAAHLDEAATGLYAVSMPGEAQRVRDDVLKAAARGDETRGARPGKRVALVGKLPGPVYPGEWLQAEVCTVRAGGIDLPVRLISRPGTSRDAGRRRSVYVEVRLPDLPAGRYEARMRFRDLGETREGVFLAEGMSPPRFGPLVCGFDVPASEELSRRLARARARYQDRDVLQGSDPDVCARARELLDFSRGARYLHPESIWELVRLGPPAVPALIVALDDPHEYVRRAAAEALTDIEPGSERVISAVTRLLKKGGRYSLMHAARHLGTMGEKAAQAVPGLIRLLESKDASVSATAVRALGDVGPSAAAALPQLLGILHGERRFLRDDAAVAIWQITEGAEDATPALAKALRQGSKDAERALARIQRFPPGTIRALRSLLDEGKLSLRSRIRIAEAVWRATGDASPALSVYVEGLESRRWQEVRDAAEFLGRMGSAAAPALPAIVRARSFVIEYNPKRKPTVPMAPRVRLAAAVAVWRIAGETSELLAAVEKTLRGGGHHGVDAVRVLAGEALPRSAVVPLLRGALRNDCMAVRREALKVLRAMEAEETADGR